MGGDGRGGGPPGRPTASQSLEDLAGLLLRDGDDRFLAAGSPWFLTLFGRDSLWAARLLLPFDTGLALSTLRVLARRQGRADDPATEEQPGKILHEVRPGLLDLGAQVLPPLYYGSVDATPLFVCTLADAHEWGGAADQVRALLPAARACLEWLLAQSEDDGWLRYVDHTGTGLSNQGWKDSSDSIPFADGRLADPPIALCEVQAYAHEAAVRGSALLAAYGEAPVPGLLDWAERLRERFAAEFWVDTPDGGHAAIALDREGRPADALTSNIGHLLGTGVLGSVATARVAELLADPRLDSGFGLRTLAADSPRFSRLGYHVRQRLAPRHRHRGPRAGGRGPPRDGGPARPRAGRRRPRASTTGCPSCTAATPPSRSTCPRRTRPPAARRPGRPRPRSPRWSRSRA